MSTLEELQARRAKLDEQIAAAGRKKKAAAVARITAAMKAEGLVPSDLATPTGPPKPKAKRAARAPASNGSNGHATIAPDASAVFPKAKKADKRHGKVAAKYRDPVSLKEWSGRGIAPSWAAGAKAAGKLHTLAI